MKKLLYIFLVVVPMLVMGQTTSENYTKTTVYQNETQNGNIPENQKLESITYFDGLGRPFQKISVKAGGEQQDIVVPIVYDQYGRMTKEYLPYATSSQNGNIHANSINNQATFYNTEKYENTLNPFAETVYDNSPLSRPLKQGAPGNSWAINPNSDNDHAVKFEYQVNTFEEGNIAKDNVMRFGVSHPNNDTEQTQLEFIAYYGEGTLQKKIIKDENWTSNQQFLKDHTTEEYVDKLGRVVLKRTFNKNKKHDTYYVYDKFENLTYVIPPKASDDIVVTTTTQTGLLSGQNFSWVDLVLVDKELAGEYQKKLSQYKNEDILTADLENKYGAQGGFSISRNTDTNELILNINFSTNESLPFKTGEIVSLKDLGEFKDTELGVIKTDDYDYTFLVKNNALFIQGEGKLLALNQSFSSNTKLNYSKNFSWVSILDVDTKFANTYLSQLKPYPNDEILNVTIENQYGGRGGMHIAVDQNDVVSLQMNINTTTPLAFREGLVVDLGLKRRIADVTLGTFSAEGFTYEFSIKENALHISGSGTITSAFPIFTGTQPSTTTNYSISTEVLQGLCYIYHYDSRNREIEKKIPGKGWEYIVYDKLSRPALLQDAKLRLDDKWFVTQYDALNRPVMTGLYWKEGNSWTRIQMQEAVENSTNLNAFRVATPVNNDNHYYDGFAFPGIKEIHTINYYDDYNFNESSLTLPSDSQVYGVQISSDTKTFPTGTKVRILGTDQWITTITHYDKKGRPIYVASKNEYLSSLDISETKLDFTGKVLESKLVHTKNGNTPIITIDRFTYDSSGRLLTQKQQINDQEEELIVANAYDELGILESKKVGNTEVNPLQEIDYNYTIRGWLKGINDVNTNDVNKLFSLKINYSNIDLLGTNPTYSDNISEIHWKTANDNNLRSYGYRYDALNRIISATFQSGIVLSNLQNNDIENYSLNNVSYDKSGNIITLERMGVTEVTNPTVDIIDQLTYNYASNSNTLVKVTDVADHAGFKDVDTVENDYMYDVNGNIISDLNKGIIPNGINYNYLNLPTSISFGNQGSISYIYDAIGSKLSKIVDNNGSLTKTQYAGRYVYKINNSGHESLDSFKLTNGYVKPLSNNTFSYTFYFKDHIGNNRLSFADMNADGSINLNSEIKEENNYYPFGLKHKGYNNQIIGTEYNYKTYQGQEISKELGYNIIEFKFRHYDPSIGRFFQIDPLAEDYEYNSTYAFQENKLGMGVELEGLELAPRNSARLYEARLKAAEKLERRGKKVEAQRMRNTANAAAEGTTLVYMAALAYFTGGRQGLIEEAIETATGIPILPNPKNIVNSTIKLADNANDILKIGKWTKVSENMSDAAASFQKQITGVDASKSFKLNGVKFDGVTNAGVLLDAKSGMGNFVAKDGSFHKWFKGKKSLVNQALRQIDASNGAKIQWHFENKDVMEATRRLFERERVKGIDLIHTIRK